RQALLLCLSQLFTTALSPRAFTASPRLPICLPSSRPSSAGVLPRYTRWIVVSLFSAVIGTCGGRPTFPARRTSVTQLCSSTRKAVDAARLSSAPGRTATDRSCASVRGSRASRPPAVDRTTPERSRPVRTGGGLRAVRDRDQSSFSSDPGSAIEGLCQEIPLDDQLADLGVQLRHLGLPAGLRI